MLFNNDLGYLHFEKELWKNKNSLEMDFCWCRKASQEHVLESGVAPRAPMVTALICSSSDTQIIIISRSPENKTSDESSFQKS